MGPTDRRWPRIAAAAGLTALLSSCSPPAEQAAPAPPPAPTPPTARPIPLPPPPLGRAELLQAITVAAGDFAAAATYPDAAAALAGRRFELRLPFGCAGPGLEAASVRYTYDAQRETLKLTAAPQVWTETSWVRDLVGGERTEAIEGFWISRPWMLAETCPPIPAPPATDSEDAEGAPPSEQAAPPPSPETVGLAQVFETGGSRLLRRGGRPYEVTRKAPASDALRSGAYRLVVGGRVLAGGDGQPIRCRSEHPDRRPTCLVRVEFERIAFENARGDVLAEWTS